MASAKAKRTHLKYPYLRACSIHRPAVYESPYSSEAVKLAQAPQAPKRPVGKPRKEQKRSQPSPRPSEPLEMAPVKDEDALYIIAGSQTTLAQLGLNENKSPFKYRFKTRMFPGEGKNQWEPYKIREREVIKVVPKNAGPKDGDDAVMGGIKEAEVEEIVEKEYYEDRESDEGAVWPIVNGRIAHHTCFYAFINHVYNTLSPTLKSGMLIVTQPGWTGADKEQLCKFLFEKFKPPGLYFYDAASAAAMAFQTADTVAVEGGNTCVVVDVGYQKTDVTAIKTSCINHTGRIVSMKNCGGHAMTKNLLDLLKPKGFTYNMCEQLKRSSICEILPPNTPLPTEGTTASETNPAAAASTGIDATSLNSIDPQQGLPRGPGPGTEAGLDGNEDNEGVLDVASIVASGKASEILAKKEKEKADKVAAKKGKSGATNEPKPAKLANSQKPKAIFQYSEPRALQTMSHPGRPANGDVGGNAAITSEHNNQGEDSHRPDSVSAMVRKETEVGIERFQADGKDHEMLHRIADAVHSCIMANPVEDRALMWDNIVVVGNGSKVRGFKESLLAVLNSKYLVSTFSSTMFTSELPSDFSTPIPTGANTPNPQGPNAGGLGHHTSGVNPLLVAATHASNPSLAPPSQQQYQQFNAGGGHHKSSHARYGQTATNIKLAAPNDYLPEWKEHGFEEGAAYGAMIHAHGAFDHNNNPPTFMSRVLWNEEGPSAIYKFSY